MTVDDLRSHLRQLIDTYVSDQAAKAHLFSLVATNSVPAKGILAKLEAARSRSMSEVDTKIVKEIARYFC
ncbi:hypothetical protein HU230_0013490 [Bradyrhizobium quebecense]|uniref:Uncharacterized protein n=1 Tax=Bradyrhizobium quebecense TaxID=2748629 RepID=A0A973WMN9_9BRAD|nr:hypothetical protein [Bradyrhizobium quebecense]UGA46991.1 hypothetical protein HU230_0013490 [Bradyrhizobium quebecense]